MSNDAKSKEYKEEKKKAAKHRSFEWSLSFLFASLLTFLFYLFICIFA